MIPLVKDTIDKKDLKYLIKWLKTTPQLTKGEITDQFEEEWSKWQGTKYSVMVNSGSSANLAMIYSLKLSGRLKNMRIVVPAVSWATTVSPIIQFGMEPILCDCDKNNLGIDTEHFERICCLYRPAALLLVHVLAFPCDMKKIKKICERYNVILLEDSCESVGSKYRGIKTGNFGLMSTFSFYFGHAISTIEGGMICTNDKQMSDILKSIRSHGWSRDLDFDTKKKLREENYINEFRELYTFYYPGFNLRATELQAFLGLEQMKKINKIVKKRKKNFLLYDKLIKNDYWKVKNDKRSYISNFSYPIITPKIDQLVEELTKNEIQTRPLICGSMEQQPFFKELYGIKNSLEFAFEVHNYGLYLPNNFYITEEEIEFICNVVNKVINE